MKKKMTVFFIFLLILSIIFFIKGYNVGNFSLKNIHNHLYFQAWISIATIILCIALAYSSFTVYKETGLESLRYVPLAMLFFILGLILTGFHNSYCKICSDLGFCGTAHNYPDAISVLSIFISFVSYLLSESEKRNLIKPIKVAKTTLIISFFIIIALLFIGVFQMDLPEPEEYKIGRINPQGFVYLAVSIFCAIAYSVFIKAYRDTRDKALLGLSIQFVVTGFAQLVASYHIFTCYWCDVEECSEFFSAGGIFILMSMFTIWYSYAPLLTTAKKIDDKGNIEEIKFFKGKT